MTPPVPTPHRTDSQRTLLWLRRLAWLCAAMMLAITSLSAFVRLVNTGVGCTPWPACYGQLADTTSAQMQPGASQAAVTVARAVHRVLASTSLLVILALTVLALKLRWRRHARLAIGLLVLALFLAGLGMAARGSLLPAVMLGNLLAGLGMLVLSVRLARLPGATQEASPLMTWAWAALALAFVQVALGTLVSSGYAGLSCPAWGRCDLSGASWQGLNPWFAPAPGTSPSHAVGALAHLLHRAAGLALFGFLAVMAWRAVRLRRLGAAVALVMLPALQIALGLALVANQLPLGGTWAHNLLAALLLALLAALTTARRAPSGTPPA